MTQHLGPIVVISGPPGAGKTTLATGLVAAEPKLKRIVSFTTREPRPGETDGTDYRFVTASEFARLFRDDRTLDVAIVGDARYGPTLASVTDVLDRGQVPVVVVNPSGGLRIVKRIPSLTIFIVAPVNELRLRLLRRGDTAAIVERRLNSFDADVAMGAEYQHQIDARSRDETLEKVLFAVRSLPVKPGSQA